MILDSSAGPLVMSCLRVWDESDQPVGDIIWLNPDTMMASAKVDETPTRVRVGRFLFRVFTAETADQLRWLIPPKLHHLIEVMDGNTK